MKIIILAGGEGARLWPLSRQDFPKQFLNFGTPFSMLQKTVLRFLKFPLAEEVLVSTTAQYFPLVQSQLQKIDSLGQCKILLEPCRRNTGPSIAFSVRYLQEISKRKSDDLFLILPSDHLIEPEELFLGCLKKIAELGESDRIMTFGIRPTRAETGYGYIEIGKPLNPIAFSVNRFIEKPNEIKAKEYLGSGNYYWNSGMFAFWGTAFFRELKTHAPDIASLCERPVSEIRANYSSAPNRSIDYAIMEKSANIAVCPLSISWSDIGSWDSVYETMEKDSNQNVKIGNVHEINTKNSLIIGGKKLISTIGLEDVLIVETEDATFISKKGESQQVRNLVAELVQKGRKEAKSHQSQFYSWGSSELLDESSEAVVYKISIEEGQECDWEAPTLSKGQGFLLEGQAAMGAKRLARFETFPFFTGKPVRIKNEGLRVVRALLVYLKEPEKILSN